MAIAGFGDRVNGVGEPPNNVTSLTTESKLLSTVLPDCEHTREKKSQTGSPKTKSRNLPERSEVPAAGQQNSFIR